MRLWRIIFISLILSLLAASACQTGQPQGSVTDDLGRSVAIKNIPRRIISLSPSNTEIVYALGLEERLIGVTSYCNYPPSVKSKPVVSEYSVVDVEKIVSLQPDLILADSIHKATVIPALERLNIPVLAINPADLEETFRGIEMIGRVTGKGQVAEDLVSSLKKRVDSVTGKTAGLTAPERPRTFFLTWHDPLWTAGSGTLVNDLILLAGGANIASALDGHRQMELESVVQSNPQVILVLSSMGEQNTSLEYIKNEPRFQATEALKKGRVYPVDADIFGRATPRSVDGLEELARLIHPELFK